MKSRQWVQLDQEPAANWPMTLYYMGAANAVKSVGGKYGPVVLIYNGRSVRECVQKGGFVNGGKKILERIEEDPNFVHWMWRRTRDLSKPLRKYSLSISRSNLNNWPRLQLVKSYERWCQMALNELSVSTFGTVLEFEEPLLSLPLFRELEKKLPIRGREQAGALFAQLTTPVGQNENRIADIKLCRLAEKFHRIESVVALQALRAYHNRFAYLRYGYSGPVKQFLETLEEYRILAKQPMSKIRRRIYDLQIADEKMRQSQKRILAKFKNDPKFVRRLIILRELAGLKRWRKKMMVRCQAAIHPLLVAIAKELGAPLIAAQSLAAWEVRPALMNQSIKRQRILARAKETVVYIKDTKWKVLPPNQARLLIKEINRSLNVKGDIRELIGMCACPGKVTGHTKVLKIAADIKKFQAGDVIVSPATSPELVSAMRQASAIVTDAGGITSHAAIVSRELNVPCIIGTKIATKVLKDGDRVEVDATKGIVRKL